jgi:multidrug resistance efflux pump
VSIGLLKAKHQSSPALALVERHRNKAEGEGNIRTEELRKSDRRRTFQTLRAPVDGTVQQLTLSTIGGVVQPAQALMVPIPYKSAARQSAGRGRGANPEQRHRLHPRRPAGSRQAGGV